MKFRPNVFWNVFLIFLAILLVLMLSSVIFAQKSEPIANGKEMRFHLAGLSIVVEITPPAQESSRVKFYIDANNRIDKCQRISGWIYVEKQETKGQEVYVQFEKPDGMVEHYSTMRNERPDVGAYFKNELYNASGFSASIPLKDGLAIDACTIRFVVKNRNGMFLSQGWKGGIKVSSQAEIVLREQESRAVNFYVDTNEKRKKGKYDYHYLSGWIYVNDQETRDQKVYVQFEKPDGTVVNYSTIQIERSDVGTGFKNQLYNASGFSASIPLKDGLDVGACKIRLVVKNRNGMHKSPAWKAWIRVGSNAGKISFFVVVNWLLVIITAIILLVSIWRDRSLLLKPSIMAILFFHVMCQWGTTIQAGRIELFLPKPWIFVLLSQGFPLIGLIVSLFTARGSARLLWLRVTKDNPNDPSKKTWAWAILAVCFFGFIVVYLNHVPFRSTGLYKIFTSPSESNQARDMSVKFLANPFLRYGYSIVMAAFAPLLAVLTTQLLLMQIRRRKWLLALLCLFCLGGVLIASSLSGARGYSAFLVLVVIFYLLLRKGFPLKPTYLVSGILLVVIFPTLLTVLREGTTVTAKNLLASLRGSIYKRIVIIPMETGLLHVHYAQTHGQFGVQAIPKLATFIGIKPLNVSNLIGKMYSGDPRTTTTSNTSYIYSYYSYFGLLAFVPCLLGLWLLDLSLLVYQKLSANMLIPCVVCISLAAIKFSSTEYTISLFSKGFLFLLLVSWVVDRAVIKIELITEKKAN